MADVYPFRDDPEELLLGLAGGRRAPRRPAEPLDPPAALLGFGAQAPRTSRQQQPPPAAEEMLLGLAPTPQQAPARTPEEQLLAERPAARPAFTSTVTGPAGTTAYDFDRGPAGNLQQSGVRPMPFDDSVYRQSLAQRGQAETGVAGTLPLTSYMSQIFNLPAGYGSPEQRLAAMQAQRADADRLRGMGEFGQKLGVDQGNLKLLQDQLAFNERNAPLERQSREQIAGMQHSPQAIRANLLTGLLMRAQTDPTIDLSRLPEQFGALSAAIDQQMGGYRGGSMPLGLAPAPAATPQPTPGPPAAAPATPPNPLGVLGTDQRVKEVLRGIRPAIGEVTTGPAGESFKLNPQLATSHLDDLANRLRGMNVSDPEVLGGLQRQIQRGALGDLTALRQGLARGLATNYLLTNPPPRDEGGRYPGTYQVPDYLTFRENAGWGSRLRRGMNDGVPYNEVVLPTGEVVPYDASAYKSTGLLGLIPDPSGELTNATNNVESRGRAAREMLPTQSLLMDLFLGRYGQPAGQGGQPGGR